MNRVDILLPYWGDVALFKDAVVSVLSQTNQNWRLMIFDDCYPSDEARQYIETLDDPRVAYTRHEKNIGITANFNYAATQATSEFCVIMGCDDIMLPGYIERVLSSTETWDMYQPGVEVIDATGKTHMPLADRVKRVLRMKQGPHSGEKLATSLSYGNWLYFPSLCWRTTSLQKYRFNETYVVVEDLLLELELIMDGGILYVDDTTTFQYRRFSESVSSKEKGGKRFKEEAEAYTYLSERFSQIGWRKAARAAKLRPMSRLHELIS